MKTQAIGVDIVMMVEHHMDGEKHLAMKKFFGNLGWRVVSGVASQTGRGGITGGTLVVARKHLQLNAHIEAEGIAMPTMSQNDRATFATIQLQENKIVLGAIYGHIGEEAGGRNLELLSAIGEKLDAWGRPFFARRGLQHGA